jgi:UDP-glucose:(heptosyl)LPS alpha-1,3-glucosyltransferase
VRLALICRPLSFHGGVETATAGLLAELVRRGHRVDLLTLGHQPAVPGVGVRRLRVPRAPSALRLLGFALAARRALRDAGYDIVQSHERALAQDVYRAGEGTHRGYLAAMGRTGFQVMPHHRLLLWLERRIFSLRAARHVIAISRSGLREIEALYGTPGDRLSLVYNGVDLARFSPDGRARWRQGIRRELGIAEEAWLVLFVGSGFERKGLGPLIEGLAGLSDGGARLLVAGKGSRGQYLVLADRLGLTDRVRWLGPRPDVERLYAAADVVALPARYEPFGNVHLEALAAGVPVLSSGAAGGAELIRSGENGWVVEAPTVPAIREGLETLRHLEPGRMCETARRSVEPFTHIRQAALMEEIWERLAR